MIVWNEVSFLSKASFVAGVNIHGVHGVWGRMWNSTVSVPGHCLLNLLEPHRDKTNKMACAPNEDSDQSGHPPSLIRVFAVRLMGS